MPRAKNITSSGTSTDNQAVMAREIFSHAVWIARRGVGAARAIAWMAQRVGRCPDAVLVSVPWTG